MIEQEEEEEELLQDKNISDLSTALNNKGMQCELCICKKVDSGV